MGIINWARSRFNGKIESTRSDLGVAGQQRRQVVPEEKHLTNEQQQWPHQDQAGLLSIGMFRNDESPLPEDLPDFTIEEAEKLHDALARLLRRATSKHSARGPGAGADSLSLPLDRFLNCPSSLEVDRTVQRKREEDGDVVGGSENGDLSPNTKIILIMAKDLLISSGNGGGAGIKNKSFKFLLKKMFV